MVRCLAYLADTAHKHHKRISVCGELAGSALGAMLLVSLGYEHLSMNYSDLGQVKYTLRHVSAAELKGLRDKALSLSSPQQIRDLYVNCAKANGLARALDFTAAQQQAYQIDPADLPEITERRGRGD